jgi:hypothetical protein
VGLAHWGVLYFSYYKEQEEKKDIRKWMLSENLEVNEAEGIQTKQTPWPLVRKWTIPPERQPLVGEVNSNFCGYYVVWTAQRVRTAVNLVFWTGGTPASLK